MKPKNNGGIPKRRIIGVPLIIIWSVLGLCCASGPGNAPHILVVGVESGPGPLDPRKGGDQATSRVMHLLFDGLVRIGPDGSVRPSLAETWEIPDPRTYIFHLRDGVTFHDGTLFDSADVRWTLESLFTPDFISIRREDLKYIETIETPDPLTVILRLSQPFSPLLFNLAMGIVPEGSDERFHLDPTGTGPFRFVRHLKDREVLLERHNGYFAGPGRMDLIRFKIVPDVTIRMLELKKGGVDLVINDVNPDVVADFRSDTRFEVLETPGCTYTYIGFNLNDPILGDNRVRRAIAMAVNREEMIHDWLRDTAVPASGLIPTMSWAHEQTLPRIAFDPQAARELLDNAGYPDPDGPQGPGSRFSLEFKGSTAEVSRQKSAILKEYLKRIGVELRIRLLEWGTFYDDVRRGNFQIYSLNWTGLGLFDPDILRTRFHSSLVPPAGLNRGQYSNPRVDELLQTGLSQTNRTERFAVYSEVQKILAEDLPYVSLWHKKNVAIVRKGVNGVDLNPTGDFYLLKDVLKESKDGNS